MAELDHRSSERRAARLRLAPRPRLRRPWVRPMSTPRAAPPAGPLAAEAEIELPGKVVDLFTRRPTGALKEEFDAMYGIDHDLHPFLYSRAAPKRRGPFHGRWRPDYFVTISDELRRAFPTVFRHHQECFGDRFDDAAAFAARVALYASGAIHQPTVHLDEAIEAFGLVLPRIRKTKVRAKTAPWRPPTTNDGIISRLHTYADTRRSSGRRLGEHRVEQLIPTDATACLTAGAVERAVSEHEQKMILSTLRLFETWCHEEECLPADHHLINTLVVTTAPIRQKVSPPPAHRVVDTAQAALILGKSRHHITWLARKGRIAGVMQGGEWKLYLPEAEVAAVVRATLPAYLPRSSYGDDQISLPEFALAIREGLPRDIERGKAMTDAPDPVTEARLRQLARLRLEQTRLLLEGCPRHAMRPAEVAGGTEADWEELPPGTFAHPSAWSGGIVPAVAILHVRRRYKPYVDGYGRLKNGVPRDIPFGAEGAAIMRRLFAIAREMREIATAAGTPWVDIETLPVSPHLREDLWPTYGWSPDQPGRPCLPLFCAADGRPGDVTELNTAFSQALLVAGFPADRCRTLGQLMKLRHLGGSIFFEALGGKREAIEATAQFMGDTVDVVRRTYVRLSRYRQMETAMRVEREIASQAEQLQVAESGDLNRLSEHLAAAREAGDREDLEAVRLHRRLGGECITRVLLAMPPEKLSDKLRDGLRAAERTFAEAEAYAQRGRPGWTGMPL